MSYPNQLQNTGLFVQTSPVFDVSALYQTEVTSPEFKELLVRLYQQVNNISMALNFKETGLYLNQEFVNSNVWFSLTAGKNSLADLRPEYIKIVNFGALGNSVLKSVAHGITIDANTSFTFIGGYATKPNSTFIPIPYVTVGVVGVGEPPGAVSIWVDTTNVNIKTDTDFSAYTTCYVVLRYLKN